jgi:hypothetical protein
MAYLYFQKKKKMQLLTEKASKTKVKKSKLKMAAGKMSQKVDRLVNTPGASRKLLAAVPQHDDSLNSQRATKKAAQGKKQKRLLEKRVEKARHIVANQQQKLKVIFIVYA